MSSGSTILELSWDTVDGYVQRVCVGWNGGIVKDRTLRRSLPSTADTKPCDVWFNDAFVSTCLLSSDVMEVPMELARCVGIVRDDMVDTRYGKSSQEMM